jgi:hypothetical protein
MHLVNGIPADGEWFLAQGRSSMIRARQGLLPQALTSGLDQRVVISWQCRAPLESGLPSEADYAELREFESLIVAFVEHGAILAFVITQDGAVHLNFYTTSTEWFLERLNEALVDKPPVPIELSAEPDPDWMEYAAVLRATGAGEGNQASS